MSRLLKPWLPVILWMGVIFVVSGHLGSHDNTSRYIEPLLRWLFPTAEPATITLLHHVLRKVGHFSEYAILAWLTLRALRLSWPGRSHTQALGAALLVAVAYAATDEYHQSFVSDRTASPVDVLIDASGAVTALAVVAVRRRRAGPR